MRCERFKDQGLAVPGASLVSLVISDLFLLSFFGQKKKIKSFESIKDTLKEVTEYLAKVDELIDFAKTVLV